MLAFKLRKFQTLVLLLLFDFEALRKLYNYYFFPRKFPEAKTQSEKLLQGKELIFCWCTWHPPPRNWNSLPIGATSAHSAICCLFLPLPFLPQWKCLIPFKKLLFAGCSCHMPPGYFLLGFLHNIFVKKLTDCGTGGCHFYQPQGWSTCAAGPGGRQGGQVAFSFFETSVHVQPFWNLWASKNLRKIKKKFQKNLKKFQFPRWVWRSGWPAW